MPIVLVGRGFRASADTQPRTFLHSFKDSWTDSLLMQGVARAKRSAHQAVTSDLNRVLVWLDGRAWYSLLLTRMVASMSVIGSGVKQEATLQAMYNPLCL